MPRIERGGYSRGKSSYPRRGSSRGSGHSSGSKEYHPRYRETLPSEAERFIREEEEAKAMAQLRWQEENAYYGERTRSRRSVSRERSRSHSFHREARDYEERDWEFNTQEYPDETSEIISKYERRERSRRSRKYNPYSWRKEDYKENEIIPESLNGYNDEVQDLREIIRRSRDETRSASREGYEEHENDNRSDYFKAFEARSKEEPRKPSSWDRKDERITPDIKLSFTKSIFNDIAVSSTSQANSEGGQFISVKDSHPEIPFFNELNQDLTPRQFLQIIERIGETHGWSTNELKCQMAAKLQGPPREWFLKDELMNEPWEKVKTQFIKMHPMDMDYYQRLCKMMERNQHENESFSNYFTFKTMLLGAVDITGRRAVSCLIGGFFNPELRGICYDKNFATPEELYEYLNSKQMDTDMLMQTRKNVNRSSPKRASEYSTKYKQTTHSYTESEHKENSLNNLLEDIDDEPFTLSKTNYDKKHLIDVKIENNILEAYNDLDAQCLTIKEHTANMIDLEYSRRRTTIIGFRGVPVLALGDCSDMRVNCDKAKVRTKIFVVPNISQEKPVIIGKSFRDHRDLIYHENQTGIGFTSRNFLSGSSDKHKDR